MAPSTSSRIPSPRRSIVRSEPGRAVRSSRPISIERANRGTSDSRWLMAHGRWKILAPCLGICLRPWAIHYPLIHRHAPTPGAVGLEIGLVDAVVAKLLADAAARQLAMLGAGVDAPAMLLQDAQ